MWEAAKKAIRNKSSFRRSKEAVAKVSGSDITATTQAYPVIMSPVNETDSSRLSAISGNRPTGKNSDVLKTNVANARPIIDSHD